METEESPPDEVKFLLPIRTELSVAALFKYPNVDAFDPVFVFVFPTSIDKRLSVSETIPSELVATHCSPVPVD